MNESVSFFVILSRALASKCPVCGRGRLFAKLYQIQRFTDLFVPLKNCGTCGFRFERQPGYYFGVVTPILPILALVTGGIFSGVTYFGFHQEVDTALVWGGVGMTIGFLLFFRTAIAIYITLDHAIDPPKQDDPPLRGKQ